MFKVNSIGSDPELVLLDSHNQPVSAVGLNVSTNNVNIYADNVLAEFNHQPFQPTEFSSGMQEVVSTVASTVSDFQSGCHFRIGQCEASYSDSQLDVPEAHAIGCEPFKSAYDYHSNQNPTPYTDNLRFAGGHIHIGYDTTKLPPHLLVQLLDEQLLPLDPNDGKTARSNFYGAKGSFRYKKYGVEYRATSNWWLAEPQLITDVLADVESFVNKKYYGA